ncbi:DUF6274 family protein [Streptomyces sp. HB132]|uniref:DUF6274 family protein n=1 Tax=Streptomyces sp. HB132 TaxID=767388 RepID=UPI00195F70BD|nr:DUF6274 family protein [Streptomyces sp. HB132]MBM7438089.1 hypothetical protein [Streptomyces sp. HB132]
MPAPTERHETRALLRAHLAAASGYRHLTPNCPICHRLLRLAMEPLTAPQAPYAPGGTDGSSEPPTGPGAATDTPAGDAGASHRAAGPTTDGDGAGVDRARDHPHGHSGDESPSAT